MKNIMLVNFCDKKLNVTESVHYDSRIIKNDSNQYWKTTAKTAFKNFKKIDTLVPQCMIWRHIQESHRPDVKLFQPEEPNKTLTLFYTKVFTY